MLLSSAFVCWVAANFFFAYGTLPYFPIEISWTLGATPANKFLNGAACAVFPVLFVLSTDIAWYHYACTGLGFAGILVGDHLGLWHNAMVKTLLLSFLWLLYDLKGAGVTVAFLAFYALRPVTKIYLIATSIQKQPLAAWMREPVQTVRSAYGYATCPKPPGHPVLKMGAVWQWLVWFTLIVLIET